MPEPKSPPPGRTTSQERPPISPSALARAASSSSLPGSAATADPVTLSGLHVVVRIPPQPGAAGRPERRAFHAADIDTVCRYWSTTAETGLSQTEAERRLSRLGPNKLPEAEG